MTDRTTDMDSSGDLRSRVVALEHQGANREQRLSVLEAWRTQRDIDSARHDERWRHMDEKIDAVGKKVDKISGDLSRIMWTILAAIIVAIVSFMVKGGFAP